MNYRSAPNPSKRLCQLLLAASVVCTTATGVRAQTHASAATHNKSSLPVIPGPGPTVHGKIKSIGSLYYVDIVKGKGKVARSGMHVTVEYTGWLLDGTKFDSSVGKQPFEFDLGAGTVIPGWDTGVAGMRVGGKRRLIVPPELGYGQDATGPIPANSTLTFDVKLLAVK